MWICSIYSHYRKIEVHTGICRVCGLKDLGLIGFRVYQFRSRGCFADG